MKQIEQSIYRLLEKINLSHSGTSSSGSIVNFPISLLNNLSSFYDNTIIISCADAELENIKEILNPIWDENSSIYFPSKSEDEFLPEGFISMAEKFRKEAVSVINSENRKINYILCAEAVLSEEIFPQKKTLPFILDGKTDYDHLLYWLSSNAYVRTEIAVNPGEFSVRGALIDVFPFTSKTPLRTNFLDEDVVIYEFDVDTQLTSNTINKRLLTPAKTETGNRTMLDLLDNPIFISIDENYTANFRSHNFGNSFNVPSEYNIDEFLSFVQKEGVSYEISELCQNFAYSFNEKEFIIPDWFFEREKKKEKQAGLQKQIKTKYSHFDISQIERGDFIVHRDHGVGVYTGLQTFTKNGLSQDFLVLEYADRSTVSVSAEKFARLGFYASKDEAGVETDSLTKGGFWNRKKEHAKKQAQEIVESLLFSYAQRQNVSRQKYLRDSDLEKLFLAKFPFEDTEDQKKVWNELTDDLNSNIPMNRLICGDVGFGKTEMAIRAAFRVVFSGKQVAVLAPTTILSNQLYQAFNDRFKDFGVTSDVISRFRSKAEVNRIKQLLYEDKIDILLGTHAILSDDIVFKNLGLLIIDEEQRFGVAQKEKIQSLRPNIDVLSMSATPIPRTLHMALSGIRKISLLMTAPKARRPIITHVIYNKQKAIEKAIRFEVERGGQVYFVHNEVKSLPPIVEKLRELFPNFNISFAHGQESPKSLEKTMSDFINKKIDVLVCTTIIETGIDVKNVNTIIINRAHRFGLAQLYQIRGRVGRSSRQAYAFLVLPRGISLQPDARKRLKAVEQNTDLGSGYNISTIDLDIRGTGSVFGYKQSGGVGRVGFDLFSKFIQDAIETQANVKKKKFLNPDEVFINLFPESTIPDNYVQSASLRVSFYIKISKADTLPELHEVEYELQNRFGPLPDSSKNLFRSAELRLLASEFGVSKLEHKDGIFELALIKNVVLKHTEELFTFFEKLFSEQKKNYAFKLRKDSEFILSIRSVREADITNLLSVIFDKFSVIFS